MSQAGLEHLMKEIRAAPLTVVLNWLPVLKQALAEPDRFHRRIPRKFV